MHLNWSSAALAALGGLACGLDRTSIPVPVAIREATVTPNAQMVTGARLQVHCSGDIVGILVSYRATAVDSGRTPRIPLSTCPATVDLLGLLPTTTYTTTITAWGAGGDSVSITGPEVLTDALPSDLPQVTTRAIGVAPQGLTALTVFDPLQALTHGVAMIVDSVGRIRWYLRADRLLSDFQPQSGTSYTLAVSPYEPLAFSVLGYVDAEYQDLDLAGNLRRKWTATGGYFTDNHDIRFTRRGTAILLGFDFRTMDLTAFGGSPTAQVLGNVLEEVDSVGHVLFFWSAFDHFAVTDLDPSIPLTTDRIDWNHANALDIDYDGNYLISIRSFSEVTKIDSRTGAVIWRLGGVRNDFLFESDAERFSFQHAVRRLPNGNLLLFDNGNTRNPPFSRAVEYRLDEQARTAKAVWTYRPSPDLYSLAVGNAQRLGNGNTLVTFGFLGVVHEVSLASELRWELTLPQGLAMYRAFRIRSLYDPSPN